MADGDGNAVVFPGTVPAGGQPEAEGAEKQQAVTGQAAVQPAGAALAASGEQQAFITMEQARAMIDEAVERVSRQAQSLTAKTENRLSKAVNDQVAALDKRIEQLKAAGMNVPAALREQAVNQITQQVLLDDALDSGQEAQPGADPNGPTPEQVKFVNTRLAQIFQEHGVQVLQNDPEVAEIDFSSPERFLVSVAAAAEKKAARTTSGAQAAPVTSQDAPANGGSPAARLPGLGGGGVRGNPIASITDPRTLLEMGLKKK